MQLLKEDQGSVRFYVLRVVELDTITIKLSVGPFRGGSDILQDLWTFKSQKVKSDVTYNHPVIVQIL